MPEWNRIAPWLGLTFLRDAPNPAEEWQALPAKRTHWAGVFAASRSVMW